MPRAVRTRLETPGRGVSVRRLLSTVVERGRTVLFDRRTRVVLAGAVAVVVVAVAAMQRDGQVAPAPVATPAAAAEAALVRLAAVPDPLRGTTADLLAAIDQSRAALGDTSSRRKQALLEARATLQLRRLQLLALEDGASDEQRARIGEVNGELQRLLTELDTTR